MRVSDFVQTMPGSLVQTMDGSPAFLPNALPPPLDWTLELVQAISEAERTMGKLAGISEMQAAGVNPHLLIRPFLRREAVLSSQIEGTIASVSDLFLFEELESSERSMPDVREVHNYVRALEYGIESLKVRSLSLGLIKELHQILMERVRGGDRTPGKFRTSQVHLGRSKKIEDATYVPPPPLMVDPAMEDLAKFIQSPSPIPALVRLALVHYQFEAIHPFNDGNGRIGRLLITLILCAEKVLPLPLLYLSAYFENRREEYYRGLREVSQKNAWQNWILYFLEGITTQSTDAIQRANQLADLRSNYRRRFQTEQRSARLLQLVDSLFQNPAISMPRAATLLNVTPQGAQNLLDKLIAAGALKEITGQERNRVYMATEIVDLLNA